MHITEKRFIINNWTYCDYCFKNTINKKLMRQYLNLKMTRNLSDRDISKRLGISRDRMIALKKEWGLKFKRQKDNMYGVSEEDFKQGSKIGLHRKLILNRIRDLGWTVEKAISEPKDETKMNNKKENVK